MDGAAADIDDGMRIFRIAAVVLVVGLVDVDDGAALARVAAFDGAARQVEGACALVAGAAVFPANGCAFLLELIAGAGRKARP